MVVVHTSNKDDATIAVAGVIRNVKLGGNLSEDQRSMLKDLTRKNPDVFTDMPGETDVIQHRVKLTEVDLEPMTMAEDGQYEFLRMPFGVVNSGATLVRGLKKVLEGLSGVSSYIDDIAIYSDSWEEHLRTLKELFGRLRRARSK